MTRRLPAQAPPGLRARDRAEGGTEHRSRNPGRFARDTVRARPRACPCGPGHDNGTSGAGRRRRDHVGGGQARGGTGGAVDIGDPAAAPAPGRPRNQNREEPASHRYPQHPGRTPRPTSNASAPTTTGCASSWAPADPTPTTSTRGIVVPDEPSRPEPLRIPDEQDFPDPFAPITNEARAAPACCPVPRSARTRLGRLPLDLSSGEVAAARRLRGAGRARRGSR